LLFDLCKKLSVTVRLNQGLLELFLIINLLAFDFITIPDPTVFHKNQSDAGQRYNKNYSPEVPTFPYDVEEQ